MSKGFYEISRKTRKLSEFTNESTKPDEGGDESALKPKKEKFK